jgi:hypothetical protein
MAYVGIVYNVVDRRIRRIIVPASDTELDGKGLVGPGEVMVRMPKGTYDQHRSEHTIAVSLGLSG